MNITNFRTLLFDCDGVVLNSNSIKTKAFRAVTLPFGKKASDTLVSYHVANGGISRYKKFDYFVDEILPATQPNNLATDRPLLKKKLLCEFAAYVTKELVKCDIAEKIIELRHKTASASWFIVSGGDQNELREVFKHRGLDKYFDGGIYGSPFTKTDIVQQLSNERKLHHPALFIGDSRLDHQVAEAFKIDFLFVSQWTEFDSWRPYCNEHHVKVVESLKLLL